MNLIKAGFVLAMAMPMLAIAADKPAPPFVNPHFADSTYQITHAASDFSPLAGPTGPGHRLTPDEVQWKPLGPVNASTLMYSGKYPNGKRVIWVGGYDRIAKVDAETLEVLTTYGVGGNTFFGEDEIRRHIAVMDRSDDKAMLDYAMNMWKEPTPYLASWYRMLSRDNELYMTSRSAEGSLVLSVYGETDANDPASRIQLRRRWVMPREVSTGFSFGMNFTSDGTVVIAAHDGALIALSRDFKTVNVLHLPNKNTEPETRDIFKAFVRNSVATDDRNGIYIVTRDNMHRVQWTGSELSLKESDGAWSAPYPNELGFGSGTTPALMGWGPNEDHLVVIADASGGDSGGKKRGNNMLAFWRDEIPADWKGIPGLDRRIAGSTPAHFNAAKDEQPQIENGLVVYGYGAFLNNTNPEQRLEGYSNRGTQWMAESLQMHVPGHGALGGTQIRWDPKERLLKTAWSNQTNFASSVCEISGATEILYCWGARNREWTLEGIDWKTGKSAFTYTLGKSHRFNVFGGPIIIAPNGSVDCGCQGGMGIVRITPRAAGKSKSAAKGH